MQLKKKKKQLTSLKPRIDSELTLTDGDENYLNTAEMRSRWFTVAAKDIAVMEFLTLELGSPRAVLGVVKYECSYIFRLKGGAAVDQNCIQSVNQNKKMLENTLCTDPNQ